MDLRLQRMGDTATPKCRRWLQAMKRPRSMLVAGADALQAEISKHLRRLQARGLFGGKATSAEKQVRITSVTARAAVVEIADPQRAQRFQGGPMRARQAKNPALPLTAEAAAATGQGNLRATLPGLKVVLLKRGTYLVRGTPGARGETRVVPVFNVLRSVSQRLQEIPDAAVMQGPVTAAMVRAARGMLRAG